MAIELISKIIQKNNGTFALIDAKNVLVDESTDQRLDAVLSSLDVSGNLDTINSQITTLQNKDTELETSVNSLQTSVNALPAIDDTAASASGLYSSSKVEDLITTAKQAVKDDLLDGAGTAYDTLKELGDLIVTNADAIASLKEIAAGHVRFDTAQELTDAQKTQARTNIGAASAADLETTETNAQKGISDAATAQAAAEAAQKAADAAQAAADGLIVVSDSAPAEAEMEAGKVYLFTASDLLA